MKAENIVSGETPEQAADGIAEALQFLRREALEAGMFEVGELIGRALKKAHAWQSPEAPVDVLSLAPKAASAKPNVMSDPEFNHLRAAIAALPKKYRDPFLLKTLYRSSYAEIADYCGISINSAVARVADGSLLVQMYSQELHDCEDQVRSERL